MVVEIQKYQLNWKRHMSRIQDMDYQNHRVPYIMQGERDTWEIPEIGDTISFKTSEHQNGLVAPRPQEGRRIT
jgi:hypothetical protein